MRPTRAYPLGCWGEGIAPAFLAPPARLDRIELVSIDDGEVALYWELPAKLASRLGRELRAALASPQAEELSDKGAGADAEDLCEERERQGRGPGRGAGGRRGRRGARDGADAGARAP